MYKKELFSLKVIKFSHILISTRRIFIQFYNVVQIFFLGKYVSHFSVSNISTEKMVELSNLKLYKTLINQSIL